MHKKENLDVDMLNAFIRYQVKFGDVLFLNHNYQIDYGSFRHQHVLKKYISLKRKKKVNLILKV